MLKRIRWYRIELPANELKVQILSESIQRYTDLNCISDEDDQSGTQGTVP